MPNIKALTFTDSNEKATCNHCGKEGHMLKNKKVSKMWKDWSS